MKKIFGFLIVILALLSISTALANEEQTSVDSNSEITTTSSNNPCTETSDDTDGEWVPLPITTMYIPDGKGGTYPTIIYQPTYIRHQKNHDNNSESGCTQKESSSIASVVIPILIVLILVLVVIYS